MAIRKVVYQLIAALCLYSNESEKAVRKLITSKQNYIEQFVHGVVKDLQISNHQLNHNCLLFINCVINIITDVRARIILRSKIWCQNFSLVIRQMRNLHEPKLTFQINQFLKNWHADEEAIAEMDGIDLTNPIQLIHAVLDKAHCLGSRETLLALFQNLLLLMDHSNIGLIESIWKYTEKLLIENDGESSQFKAYFPNSQHTLIDNWTERDVRTSNKENHQITTVTLKKTTPIATITHITTTIIRPSLLSKDKLATVHLSVNPTYKDASSLPDIDHFDIPQLHLRDRCDDNNNTTSSCTSRKMQWQPRYWIHLPAVTKIHPQSIWNLIQNKPLQSPLTNPDSVFNTQLNGKKKEITSGFKLNKAGSQFYHPIIFVTKIFLHQLTTCYNSNTEDVLQAIRYADRQQLPIRIFQRLQMIMEELEPEKKLTLRLTNKLSLGYIDLFLYSVINIPSYLNRIKYIIAVEECANYFEKWKSALSSYIKIIEDLLESQSLVEFMEVVLLGKFAKGFSLKVLIALINTTMDNSDHLLIDYIVKHIIDSQSHCLSWLDLLPSLKSCIKLPYCEIKSSILTLESKLLLLRCGAEMELIPEIKTKIIEFVEKYKRESNAITIMTKTMEKQSQRLAHYFCEDKQTVDIDVILQQLFMMMAAVHGATEESVENEKINITLSYPLLGRKLRSKFSLENQSMTKKNRNIIDQLLDKVSYQFQENPYPLVRRTSKREQELKALIATYQIPPDGNKKKLIYKSKSSDELIRRRSSFLKPVTTTEKHPITTSYDYAYENAQSLQNSNSDGVELMQTTNAEECSSRENYDTDNKLNGSGNVDIAIKITKDTTTNHEMLQNKRVRKERADSLHAGNNQYIQLNQCFNNGTLCCHQTLMFDGTRSKSLVNLFSKQTEISNTLNGDNGFKSIDELRKRKLNATIV
ncbi:uncharacterized protein TRIADDRAFT_56670 [Trichoplax adhaerens]|uniref:Uncharacterized protein n=1 Tax=Trichoplax adhaerens TaxID=10228 RepID=B3RW95_TRIAD|nr:predicted protein [Trichoplax adhaerens]EDV25097.1 predicted protein [Trichoplax adhaerens]|eukprot:XP_002112987.1 predicted protein [Trichoplax adhaerens]